MWSLVPTLPRLELRLVLRLLCCTAQGAVELEVASARSGVGDGAGGPEIASHVSVGISIRIAAVDDNARSRIPSK